MLISIKRLIASLLTVFLILLSWIISYEYHCIALLFPLIVWLLISYSFVALKMQERECFRRCYFQEKTLISRLLASRFMVILFYLIISTMMSITILSSAMEYTQIWWLYLVIHTLLSLILYRTILYLSATIITPSHQKLFAREWTINGMTLLILPFFIYLALNSYAPEYLKESFIETINSASNRVYSKCEITQKLLIWNREVDAGLWWLVYSSASYAKALWLKSGIWISFIIYNSIAILGINRLIVQVIYLIDILFQRKKL